MQIFLVIFVGLVYWSYRSLRNDKIIHSHINKQIKKAEVEGDTERIKKFKEFKNNL